MRSLPTDNAFRVTILVSCASQTLGHIIHPSPQLTHEVKRKEDMPSNYLPPGCGRLPGEEPEEPLHWALAEMVAKQLKEDHSDWRERGNRSVYIASDCWKDADLDGISTGIISVVGNDSGITVEWGWLATFCSGDERADEAAQEAILGCGIPGEWDCDNDGDGASWAVSGRDSFQIDPEDFIGCENPPTDADAKRIADEVWAAFLLERTTLEQEAEYIHEALNENYKEVTREDA